MAKRDDDGLLNGLLLEAAREQLELLGIHEEPGWYGAFSRKHHSGAIPNSTPIRKVKSEPGDTNPVGTTGLVLGSILAPGETRVLYFVEWDSMPKRAFAIIGWKIAPVRQ